VSLVATVLLQKFVGIATTNFNHGASKQQRILLYLHTCL
jgi:hypothetical protein